ncbi:MAG: peptidoglycan-binding protein [Aurantimonas endophytica]|uniref:glycoside hydrolase family protein n=1 Tax=Aurantimonas endophytica TaxID=1522175 RepID=UPI00300100E3
MDMSPAGAKFVGHHEGFVPRYYLDPVGVGTIGTGFTWASSALRSWWAKNRPGQKFGPGATMTRAEAAEVLVLLMREEYGAAVNRFLGKTVAQHVFDAMASVTFNCGADTLTDRWAAAVKRGDINAAADLLKTTRVTAKKKRLAGLVSRRLDESELLEQADYTIGRPAVDPMADGMLVRRERGEAVRQLQLDLQAVGIYADGVVDGIFGYGTEAAVMEFQRSVGLDDDGFAGPATLAALKGAEPAPPIVVPEKPAPVDVPPAVPAPGAPLTADQYLTIAETALAGLRQLQEA